MTWSCSSTMISSRSIRGLVRRMAETLGGLGPNDIVSCWTALWTEWNDAQLTKVRMGFLYPQTTGLTECDYVGPGVSMFNKRILYHREVLDTRRGVPPLGLGLVPVGHRDGAGKPEVLHAVLRDAADASGIQDATRSATCPDSAPASTRPTSRCGSAAMSRCSPLNGTRAGAIRRRRWRRGPFDSRPTRGENQAAGVADARRALFDDQHRHHPEHPVLRFRVRAGCDSGTPRCPDWCSSRSRPSVRRGRR